MAGNNLTLKDQQVLFRTGDKPEGMYIVRKGELIVYLEQEGREVPLAKLGAGSIVGEMAFFDQKPRSASVKAGQTGTEVTLITATDFGKLMKQIPKWFVSIMSALSSRLRTTNDKLSKIENATNGNKTPYEDLMRTLHVLSLVFHRDGEKSEDKKWILAHEVAVKSLVDIFKSDPDWVERVLRSLVAGKVLSPGKNSYGKNAYTVGRRSVFSEISEFIGRFLQNNSDVTFYPESVIQMLSILKEIASVATYSNSVISIDAVKEMAEGRSVDSSEFEDNIKYFKTGIQGVDLAPGEAIGFKVDTKLLNNSIIYLKLLFEFHKEALE